jgi:hypothetical protein
MYTGALDDEMPARNVTYGTPSPITNPSRWMMESVKSVPFGSFALHPSSLALAPFARSSAHSRLPFPSSRVGVLVFVFRGVEFFVVCLERERESGKGISGGFYFFFFGVWFWVSFCGVRMGRSRSYSPPVRRERSRSPAPPRRGRHIDDGWSRGDGRDSRKHGRDRNSGGRHRSPPTSLLVRNISRDSRLSCYLFSNCLVCICTVHFSG